jgi:hypothetical protein
MLKKHVYQAYVSFCGDNNFECTNAASFGKIFKRVFPRVQMARLVVDKGKKGWHYSGLTLRKTPRDGRGGHQGLVPLDESMDADERVAGRRRRRERRPPSPTQSYQQTFRLVSGDRPVPTAIDGSRYTHHTLPAAPPRHINGPTSSAPQMSLGHILSASSATTDPFSFATGYSLSSSDRASPFPDDPYPTPSPSFTAEAPGELRSKRKRSLEQDILEYDVVKSTADESAREGGRRNSSSEYVPLSVDIKRSKGNLRPFDLSPVASNPMSPVSTSFVSTDNNSQSRQAVAGRSGIWNSNSHLYLIETLHQYCRVFRQESWAALYVLCSL